MTTRLLYEGSITVSSTDYIHPVYDEAGGDYEEVAIEGLDELVTRRSEITFALDYPFEHTYEAKIVGDNGVTLRQIIDAIRHGFRVMYRGAAHEPIAGMINQRVYGDYGQAMHAIDDLVIEVLELDEATGVLDVGIGS
jgi:hypothetical protein